jgi:hypothetical protein
MCRYSAPPGYVRSKAPERPKLGPLVPIIDAILEADKTAPCEEDQADENRDRMAAQRASANLVPALISGPQVPVWLVRRRICAVRLAILRHWATLAGLFCERALDLILGGRSSN